MSIEKTRYGTWRARWRDQNGEQRARSFKRRVDAERHMATLLIDTGAYVPSPTKLTVAAWADEWLAGAHNLRPGGRATYRRDLDRYILPALGDIQLARLTPQRLDELLTDLGSTLAPATVHRQYRTLRRMLNVAVLRRNIPTSPLLYVEAPRVPAGEMRFLTVDELDRLTDAMDERYRAWVLVAGWGGLRWSETVGLRRRNVDVERCRVHVVEQYVEGQWAEPKSAQSRRWVSLPSSLRPILEKHLESHEDELMFPAPRGGPLGSSFRNRFWLPACLAAGLAEKTEEGKIVGAPRIHDLRHTAVALAIAAGGHPKAIQARMGHSSITVTLDRYGHLFESLDADLAAGLDALR